MIGDGQKMAKFDEKSLAMSNTHFLNRLLVSDSQFNNIKSGNNLQIKAFLRSIISTVNCAGIIAEMPCRATLAC